MFTYIGIDGNYHLSILVWWVELIIYDRYVYKLKIKFMSQWIPISDTKNMNIKNERISLEHYVTWTINYATKQIQK